MRPLPDMILLTACTLLLVLNNAAHAETNPPLNTLAQTIDTALANNPELSIMQASIEQADAKLGQALAIFYPQIKTSLPYQQVASIK
jgi:outer membrane protein